MELTRITALLDVLKKFHVSDKACKDISTYWESLKPYERESFTYYLREALEHKEPFSRSVCCIGQSATAQFLTLCLECLWRGLRCPTGWNEDISMWNEGEFTLAYYTGVGGSLSPQQHRETPFFHWSPNPERSDFVSINVQYRMEKHELIVYQPTLKQATGTSYEGVRRTYITYRCSGTEIGEQLLDILNCLCRTCGTVKKVKKMRQIVDTFLTSEKDMQ